VAITLIGIAGDGNVDLPGIGIRQPGSGTIGP
jgi:hypothetical protein